MSLVLQAVPTAGPKRLRLLIVVDRVVGQSGADASGAAIVHAVDQVANTVPIVAEYDVTWCVSSTISTKYDCPANELRAELFLKGKPFQLQPSADFGSASFLVANKQTDADIVIIVTSGMIVANGSRVSLTKPTMVLGMAADGVVDDVCAGALDQFRTVDTDLHSRCANRVTQSDILEFLRSPLAVLQNTTFEPPPVEASVTEVSVVAAPQTPTTVGATLITPMEARTPGPFTPHPVNSTVSATPAATANVNIPLLPALMIGALGALSVAAGGAALFLRQKGRQVAKAAPTYAYIVVGNRGRTVHLTGPLLLTPELSLGRPTSASKRPGEYAGIVEHLPNVWAIDRQTFSDHIYVNGILTQKKRLISGDVIRVGDAPGVELIFRAEPAPDTSHKRIS